MPFGGNQRFGQAFLAHRQPLYLNVADPLFYPPNQLQIRPVLHIADHDIRVGAFPRGLDRHDKLRVPDPAANQCGVKNHRLYESVPAAPQHFIFFRLLHAADRIGPDVNKRASGKPLDKQPQVSRQDGGAGRFQPVLIRNFNIGDDSAGKALHIRYILPNGRGQFEKILQHFLHYLVFDHPVHKQEGAAAPRDFCVPANKIKGFFRLKNPQNFFQHPKAPFRRFYCSPTGFFLCKSLQYRRTSLSSTARLSKKSPF